MEISESPRLDFLVIHETQGDRTRTIKGTGSAAELQHRGTYEMNTTVQQIDQALADAGVAVTFGAEEACRLLRVDRRTLGRMIASKTLAASRATPAGSSRLLIRRREVARLLAALEDMHSAPRRRA